MNDRKIIDALSSMPRAGWQTDKSRIPNIQGLRLDVVVSGGTVIHGIWIDKSKHTGLHRLKGFPKGMGYGDVLAWRPAQ